MFNTHFFREAWYYSSTKPYTNGHLLVMTLLSNRMTTFNSIWYSHWQVLIFTGKGSQTIIPLDILLPRYEVLIITWNLRVFEIFRDFYSLHALDCTTTSAYVMQVGSNLWLTNTGCSVWEICQICLRICIELGLHQHPRKLPENLLAEQMNRRVFWECYMLDRISSITLGRPFGIEE